jgi:hypothetical protein
MLSPMTDRNAPSSPIPTEHPLAHSPDLPAGVPEGTKLGHQSGLADLHLELNGIGAPRIVVNGQDITDNVKSYALQHLGPQTIPTLVVELLSGSGVVDGPGVVQVLPDENGAAQTLGAAVAEFLDGIDPTELQAAVFSGGMGSDPIEACLDELRRRARSL